MSLDIKKFGFFPASGGGGGGGGGSNVQVLYAPSDITSANELFIPLGFADGAQPTLVANMRGFVALGGVGDNLVVRIQIATTVTVRVYLNGATSGDIVYTTTDTYSGNETKVFDLSSVTFNTGDFIGISFEGAVAPRVSYGALGIIPT